MGKSGIFRKVYRSTRPFLSEVSQGLPLVVLSFGLDEPVPHIVVEQAEQ